MPPALLTAIWQTGRCELNCFGTSALAFLRSERYRSICFIHISFAGLVIPLRAKTAGSPTEGRGDPSGKGKSGPSIRGTPHRQGTNPSRGGCERPPYFRGEGDRRGDPSL